MSRISKAVKKLLKSGKQSPFPDDENLLMMGLLTLNEVRGVSKDCNLANYDGIIAVTVANNQPAFTNPLQTTTGSTVQVMHWDAFEKLEKQTSELKKSKIDDSFETSEREIEFGEDE